MLIIVLFSVPKRWKCMPIVDVVPHNQTENAVYTSGSNIKRLLISKHSLESPTYSIGEHPSH